MVTEKPEKEKKTWTSIVNKAIVASLIVATTGILAAVPLISGIYTASAASEPEESKDEGGLDVTVLQTAMERRSKLVATLGNIAEASSDTAQCVISPTGIC